MSKIDISKIKRRKVEGVWIAEVPEIVLKELLERSMVYDEISQQNKRYREGLEKAVKIMKDYALGDVQAEIDMMYFVEEWNKEESE